MAPDRTQINLLTDPVLRDAVRQWCNEQSISITALWEVLVTLLVIEDKLPPRLKRMIIARARRVSAQRRQRPK